MKSNVGPYGEAAPAWATELLEEIRLLRRDLRLPKSSVSRTDRARLEQVLPAICGLVGSELFLASELLEHESPGCTWCWTVAPRAAWAGY